MKCATRTGQFFGLFSLLLLTACRLPVTEESVTPASPALPSPPASVSAQPNLPYPSSQATNDRAGANELRGSRHSLSDVAPASYQESAAHAAEETASPIVLSYGGLPGAGAAAESWTGSTAPHCPGCPPAGPSAYRHGPGYRNPSQVLDAAAAPGVCEPIGAPGWPADEYICDGGDEGIPARVMKDWSIGGLELEDTVVHYDTVDGKTFIQPTNKVCIYAPRFAAVRRVYGIVQHNHHQTSAGVEQPIGIVKMDDVNQATTVIQPLQPGRHQASGAPQTFRERTRTAGTDNRQKAIGTHGGFLPFEDFSLIRRGQMDNSEKARLALRMDAALEWSTPEAVQVVIDNIAAHEDVGEQSLGSLHVFELPEGKSRVRICKVASAQNAASGEEVEFTIRFDNVGDRLIGNVTIADNLTTRLEYVDGSQECTLPAEFSISENDGASLLLKWDITQPLPVGEGGIIRFRCRVR